MVQLILWRKTNLNNTRLEIFYMFFDTWKRECVERDCRLLFGKRKPTQITRRWDKLGIPWPVKSSETIAFSECPLEPKMQLERWREFSFAHLEKFILRHLSIWIFHRYGKLKIYPPWSKVHWIRVTMCKRQMDTVLFWAVGRCKYAFLKVSGGLKHLSIPK